jgi:hypothetical protein
MNPRLPEPDQAESFIDYRLVSVRACYSKLRLGSRPLAVLRRSEQTRSSSASDDEVGELKGAIRAERAKRVQQSTLTSLWS